MKSGAEHACVFTLDPARAYPVLERGDGVYLYDDQGRRYLDAIAGIAAVAVGYGRKRIADAMAAQAVRLAYAASNIFTHAPALELAGLIARYMPGDCTSIHFTSGGSEAVEAAIKIGRQYQVERGRAGKHLVIARRTSYHGATLGALSATGYPGRRRKFMPLLLDWPHIPAAYCYRCPFEKRYPGCALPCADALEEQILASGPDHVMAFIAEPVVGAAGGALVPPPEYWPRIREICTRHDVLLIADEVMTGFGRTGRPFAVEHWQVAPDLVTMAKGISSGYAPLGAVGVSRAVRAVFEDKAVPLDHIFTFSAHPVAAAAAIEALKIWEEEKLTENAARVGACLMDRLQRLKKYPMVGDVRGIGLLVAIEFVADRASRQPYPAELGVARRVARSALMHGLVTYPGAGAADGVNGDILCLFPPLTLETGHVDDIIGILDRTLAQVQDSLPGGLAGAK